MYQIVLKKRAKKFLEKLPNGEDIKALKGYDNLLRLRVGEYRIIYTVNNGECVILVIDAGNRGEIYKRY
jgi:cytotoxic translational repressor of toxin-antitoxin stability system|uniref:type II toxin-antitoxin system RelE family toxin n=1 Tax=Roseburia sp. TaxID=2049040 RepID=UPI003FEDB0E0